MASELQDNLTAFIVETTGMAEDEFDAATPLYSEGYIDSFALTTIISFLEEQAGCEIPGDDVTLENFDTVEKMVAYLGRLPS